jgi:hypothetical protein
MRNISMASFRTDKAIAAIVTAIANNTGPVRIHVGQIIGQVDATSKTVGEDKDGKEQVNWKMLGEFEAKAIGIDGKVGETLTSNVAYMPRYYTEIVEAALAKTGGGSIFIGADIYMISEPKAATKYAYDVVNLKSRAKGNPLDAMKAEMAKMGVLKLDAPKAHALASPEPETTTVDGEVVDDETGEVTTTTPPAETHVAKGKKAA